MKIYKRIRDAKEPTFDSLEMLCNTEALQGWRVIDITNGDTFRTATLEKDYEPTTIENNQRNGLQIVSPAAATGNAVVKRRTQNHPPSP